MSREFPLPGQQFQVVHRWDREGRSKGASHGFVPYEDVLFSHMVTMSLVWLNEAVALAEGRLSETTRPDGKTLPDMLHNYVQAHASRYMIQMDEAYLPSRDKIGMLDPDRLDRQVVRAATFAARIWDRDFTKKKSQAGALGGSRSRRGRKRPSEILLTMPGMTDAQIAKKLKLSVRTIERMRADLKRQGLVTPQKKS